MSLKSVDLNYGFNGEPSSASLSFVYKKKTCGNFEAQSPIGTFNGPVITGNSSIDSILKDFVVLEIKENKDSGYKTISYELVDKQAKRLECIAILVRGISAPTTGRLYSSYKREYFNSESGLLGASYFADSDIWKNGDIITMGRAFSVITASVGNESATRFYSKGALVGQSPKGELGLEMNQKFKESRTGASLKYGYYLSDFRAALEQCGYTVVDFPQDSNFVILDFGGSLKDCISSIASMYGLYWSCRKNVITFYSSRKISSLPIPNFNEYTDEKILSSSYSRDVGGKKKIGVIVGTSSVEESGGVSFESKPKGITIAFGLTQIQDLFSSSGQSSVLEIIKRFLSLFTFGGDENLFDIMFLRSYAEDGYFSNNAVIDKLYGSENELDDKSFKTVSSLKDSGIESVIKQSAPSDPRVLSLLKSGGGHVSLPSKSNVFPVIKAICESFQSVYVSKGYSERVATKYSIMPAEGLSVSKAYPASTRIDSIPELASIAAALRSIYGSGFTPPTIQSLSLKLSFNTGTTSTIAGGGYYFVATKELTANGGTSFGQAKEDLDAISSTALPTSLPIEAGGPWMACSSGRSSLIGRAMLSSLSMFNSLNAPNRQVSMKSLEIQEESSSSSSGEVDNSLYNGEFKSFNVKVDSTNSELAAVEIVNMSGNASEADFLSSNFSQISDFGFLAESSSATYFGLKIPDSNPLLTSISINFNGGAIETSLSYSKKEFLGLDQNVIMAGLGSNQIRNFNKSLRTRQKNFLGVN